MVPKLEHWCKKSSDTNIVRYSILYECWGIDTECGFVVDFEYCPYCGDKLT